MQQVDNAYTKVGKVLESDEDSSMSDESVAHGREYRPRSAKRARHVINLDSDDYDDYDDYGMKSAPNSGLRSGMPIKNSAPSVSYTHLTLPTKRIV